MFPLSSSRSFLRIASAPMTAAAAKQKEEEEKKQEAVHLKKKTQPEFSYNSLRDSGKVN
jgi:hypothetical protein